LEISQLLLLSGLFFIIATLYSSVGFGGGSSYLAILAIFLISFYTIRSIALVCNLLVVSISTYWFIKSKVFNWKLFYPFVITSIPLAYIGASFRLEERVFFIILGLTLITSSIFLIWQTKRLDKERKAKATPSFLNYILGGVIGLLSGLVGIGGGIFLAPLLHHLKWNKTITIAALSSFFILVNSLSGIIGLAVNNTLQLPIKETIVLAIAVLLGGQLGIRISLKKLTPSLIKKITALLVFIVGLRVLFINGLNLL
jgi:hypothetical protein